MLYSNGINVNDTLKTARVDGSMVQNNV